MKWLDPRTWFSTKRVSEASLTDIVGTPVDFERLYSFRGMPLYTVNGPERHPEKATTLRTRQQFDRVRTMARQLVETHPNAAGLVDRMIDYAIAAGSTTKVTAHHDDEDPPPRLQRSVEDLLEQFDETNDWPAIEEEMLWRLLVDGEFFLRLFPDDDHITKVRFVDPGQVQPPAGESDEGPWSFGVYTPMNDACAPLAYNVYDPVTKTDEYVEAQFVIHRKLFGPQAQKRGISAFYAVDGEVRGATRLRAATREGEKARQSIAYFRQYAAANGETIRAIQQSTLTDTLQVTTPTGTREVAVEDIVPGRVVDVPKSLVAIPPPSSPNAEASARSIAVSLESVAARFGVPAWVVTGDSGQTNFAASLTAESPFIKQLERLQARLSRWVRETKRRVIEVALEEGILSSGVLEDTRLSVTFPTAVVRNKLEETQRRKILRDNSVISESTWRAEEGYTDRELHLMRQERQDQLQQLPTMVRATVDTPNAQYAAQTNRPE